MSIITTIPPLSPEVIQLRNNWKELQARRQAGASVDQLIALLVTSIAGDFPRLCGRDLHGTNFVACFADGESLFHMLCFVLKHLQSTQNPSVCARNINYLQLLMMVTTMLEPTAHPDPDRHRPIYERYLSHAVMSGLPEVLARNVKSFFELLSSGAMMAEEGSGAGAAANAGEGGAAASGTPPETPRQQLSRIRDYAVLEAERSIEETLDELGEEEEQEEDVPLSEGEVNNNKSSPTTTTDASHQSSGGPKHRHVRSGSAANGSFGGNSCSSITANNNNTLSSIAVRFATRNINALLSLLSPQAQSVHSTVRHVVADNSVILCNSFAEQLKFPHSAAGSVAGQVEKLLNLALCCAQFPHSVLPAAQMLQACLASLNRSFEAAVLFLAADRRQQQQGEQRHKYAGERLQVTFAALRSLRSVLSCCVTTRPLPIDPSSSPLLLKEFNKELGELLTVLAESFETATAGSDDQRKENQRHIQTLVELLSTVATAPIGEYVPEESPAQQQRREQLERERREALELERQQREAAAEAAKKDMGFFDKLGKSISNAVKGGGGSGGGGSHNNNNSSKSETDLHNLHVQSEAAAAAAAQPAGMSAAAIAKALATNSVLRNMTTSGVVGAHVVTVPGMLHTMAAFIVRCGGEGALCERLTDKLLGWVGSVSAGDLSWAVRSQIIFFILDNCGRINSRLQVALIASINVLAEYSSNHNLMMQQHQHQQHHHNNHHHYNNNNNNNNNNNHHPRHTPVSMLRPEQRDPLSDNFDPLIVPASASGGDPMLRNDRRTAEQQQEEINKKKLHHDPEVDNSSIANIVMKLAALLQPPAPALKKGFGTSPLMATPAASATAAAPTPGVDSSVPPPSLTYDGAAATFMLFNSIIRGLGGDQQLASDLIRSGFGIVLRIVEHYISHDERAALCFRIDRAMLPAAPAPKKRRGTIAPSAASNINNNNNITIMMNENGSSSSSGGGAAESDSNVTSMNHSESTNNNNNNNNNNDDDDDDDGDTRTEEQIAADTEEDNRRKHNATLFALLSELWNLVLQSCDNESFAMYCDMHRAVDVLLRCSNATHGIATSASARAMCRTLVGRAPQCAQHLVSFLKRGIRESLDAEHHLLQLQREEEQKEHQHYTPLRPSLAALTGLSAATPGHTFAAQFASSIGAGESGSTAVASDTLSQSILSVIYIIIDSQRGAHNVQQFLRYGGLTTAVELFALVARQHDDPTTLTPRLRPVSLLLSVLAPHVRFFSESHSLYRLLLGAMQAKYPVRHHHQQYHNNNNNSSGLPQQQQQLLPQDEAHLLAATSNINKSVTAAQLIIDIATLQLVVDGTDTVELWLQRSLDPEEELRSNYSSTSRKRNNNNNNSSSSKNLRNENALPPQLKNVSYGPFLLREPLRSSLGPTQLSLCIVPDLFVELIRWYSEAATTNQQQQQQQQNKDKERDKEKEREREKDEGSTPSSLAATTSSISPTPAAVVVPSSSNGSGAASTTAAATVTTVATVTAGIQQHLPALLRVIVHITKRFMIIPTQEFAIFAARHDLPPQLIPRAIMSDAVIVNHILKHPDRKKGIQRALIAAQLSVRSQAMHLVCDGAVVGEAECVFPPPAAAGGWSLAAWWRWDFDRREVDAMVECFKRNTVAAAAITSPNETSTPVTSSGASGGGSSNRIKREMMRVPSIRLFDVTWSAPYSRKRCSIVATVSPFPRPASAAETTSSSSFYFASMASSNASSPTSAMPSALAQQQQAPTLLLSQFSSTLLTITMSFGGSESVMQRYVLPESSDRWCHLAISRVRPQLSSGGAGAGGASGRSALPPLVAMPPLAAEYLVVYRDGVLCTPFQTVAPCSVMGSLEEVLAQNMKLCATTRHSSSMNLASASVAATPPSTVVPTTTTMSSLLDEQQERNRQQQLRAELERVLDESPTGAPPTAPAGAVASPNSGLTHLDLVIGMGTATSVSAGSNNESSSSQPNPAMPAFDTNTLRLTNLYLMSKPTSSGTAVAFVTQSFVSPPCTRASLHTAALRAEDLILPSALRENAVRAAAAWTRAKVPITLAPNQRLPTCPETTIEDFIVALHPAQAVRQQSALRLSETMETKQWALLNLAGTRRRPREPFVLRGFHSFPTVNRYEFCHRATCLGGVDVLLQWLQEAIKAENVEGMVGTLRILSMIALRVNFPRCIGQALWQAVARVMTKAHKDIRIVRALLEVAFVDPETMEALQTVDEYDDNIDDDEEEENAANEDCFGGTAAIDELRRQQKEEVQYESQTRFEKALVCNVTLVEQALLQWSITAHKPDFVVAEIMSALTQLLSDRNPFCHYNASRLFRSQLMMHLTYGTARHCLSPSSMIACGRVMENTLRCAGEWLPLSVGRALAFVMLTVPHGADDAALKERLFTLMPVRGYLDSLRNVVLRAFVDALAQFNDGWYPPLASSSSSSSSAGADFGLTAMGNFNASSANILAATATMSSAAAAAASASAPTNAAPSPLLTAVAGRCPPWLLGFLIGPDSSSETSALALRLLERLSLVQAYRQWCAREDFLSLLAARLPLLAHDKEVLSIVTRLALGGRPQGFAQPYDFFAANVAVSGAWFKNAFGPPVAVREYLPLLFSMLDTLLAGAEARKFPEAIKQQLQQQAAAAATSSTTTTAGARSRLSPSSIDQPPSATSSVASSFAYDSTQHQHQSQQLSRRGSQRMEGSSRLVTRRSPRWRRMVGAVFAVVFLEFLRKGTKTKMAAGAVATTTTTMSTASTTGNTTAATSPSRHSEDVNNNNNNHTDENSAIIKQQVTPPRDDGSFNDEQQLQRQESGLSPAATTPAVAPLSVAHFKFVPLCRSSDPIDRRQLPPLAEDEVEALIKQRVSIVCRIYSLCVSQMAAFPGDMLPAIVDFSSQGGSSSGSGGVAAAGGGGGGSQPILDIVTRAMHLGAQQLLASRQQQPQPRYSVALEDAQLVCNEDETTVMPIGPDDAVAEVPPYLLYRVMHLTDASVLHVSETDNPLFASTLQFLTKLIEGALPSSESSSATQLVTLMHYLLCRCQTFFFNSVNTSPSLSAIYVSSVIVRTALSAAQAKFAAAMNRRAQDPTSPSKVATPVMQHILAVATANVHLSKLLAERLACGLVVPLQAFFSFLAELVRELQSLSSGGGAGPASADFGVLRKKVARTFLDCILYVSSSSFHRYSRLLMGEAREILAAHVPTDLVSKAVLDDGSTMPNDFLRKLLPRMLELSFDAAAEDQPDSTRKSLTSVWRAVHTAFKTHQTFVNTFKLIQNNNSTAKVDFDAAFLMLYDKHFADNFADWLSDNRSQIGYGVRQAFHISATSNVTVSIVGVISRGPLALDYINPRLLSMAVARLSYAISLEEKARAGRLQQVTTAADELSNPPLDPQQQQWIYRNREAQIEQRTFVHPAVVGVDEKTRLAAEFNAQSSPSVRAIVPSDTAALVATYCPDTGLVFHARPGSDRAGTPFPSLTTYVGGGAAPFMDRNERGGAGDGSSSLGILSPASRRIAVRLFSDEKAEPVFASNVYVVSGIDYTIAVMIMTQNEIIFVSHCTLTSSGDLQIAPQQEHFADLEQKQASTGNLRDFFSRLVNRGKKQQKELESNATHNFSQVFREARARAAVAQQQQQQQQGSSSNNNNNNNNNNKNSSSTSSSNREGVAKIWRFNTNWIALARHRLFHHQDAAMELVLDGGAKWFFVMLDCDFIMSQEIRDECCELLRSGAVSTSAGPSSTAVYNFMNTSAAASAMSPSASTGLGGLLSSDDAALSATLRRAGSTLAQQQVLAVTAQSSAGSVAPAAAAAAAVAASSSPSAPPPVGGGGGGGVGTNSSNSGILVLDNKTMKEHRKSSQDLWLRRQLSNLNYILALNEMGARTTADWTQFPVFPWVITDYVSQTLDLDSPAVYRDLTKPVGALNPARAEELEARYRDWPDEAQKPFHHGTHYSTSHIVMHFLIRFQPFLDMHKKYQNGRVDRADRLFCSVAESWTSVMTGRGDVKELIADWFLSGDIFAATGVDLGTKQDNTAVGAVVLPPWAGNSPHRFAALQRYALESGAVTQMLPDWADLIFGVKQQGEAAVKALNVFASATYDTGLLEAMTKFETVDDCASFVAQLQNFGLTPRMFLKQPHDKAPVIMMPMNDGSGIMATASTVLSRQQQFLSRFSSGKFVPVAPSSSNASDSGATSILHNPMSAACGMRLASNRGSAAVGGDAAGGATATGNGVFSAAAAGILGIIGNMGGGNDAGATLVCNSKYYVVLGASPPFSWLVFDGHWGVSVHSDAAGGGERCLSRLPSTFAFGCGPLTHVIANVTGSVVCLGATSGQLFIYRRGIREDAHAYNLVQILQPPIIKPVAAAASATTTTATTTAAATPAVAALAQMSTSTSTSPSPAPRPATAFPSTVADTQTAAAAPPSSSSHTTAAAAHHGSDHRITLCKFLRDQCIAVVYDNNHLVVWMCTVERAEYVWDIKLPSGVPDHVDTSPIVAVSAQSTGPYWQRVLVAQERSLVVLSPHGVVLGRISLEQRLGTALSTFPPGCASLEVSGATATGAAATFGVAGEESFGAAGSSSTTSYDDIISPFASSGNSFAEQQSETALNAPVINVSPAPRNSSSGGGGTVAEQRRPPQPPLPRSSFSTAFILSMPTYCSFGDVVVCGHADGSLSTWQVELSRDSRWVECFRFCHQTTLPMSPGAGAGPATSTVTAITTNCAAAAPSSSPFVLAIGYADRSVVTYVAKE